MATKKKAAAPKKKPSLLTDEDKKFFEVYINNPSPTGFEAEGQKLWLSYLKPAIDKYEVDNYGPVGGSFLAIELKYFIPNTGGNGQNFERGPIE